MSPFGDVTNEALARDANATARNVRRPLVSMMRFQLGGALLLGGVLPILLNSWLLTGDLDFFFFNVGQINTSAAAIVALIYGYYGIVQFRLYPGARTTAFVLPSLIVSFGVVAMVLFFARVDYSRFTFSRVSCWGPRGSMASSFSGAAG